MEFLEINLVRLRKIVHALHSSVEEHTTQIRICGRHRLDETFQAFAVGDVVGDPTGFGAPVLGDEGIDSVLAAAHGDDFGAGLDEPFSHTLADAGGCSDEEDLFGRERERERHDELILTLDLSEE